MRPITDDVVLDLMKNLQSREKKAVAKREDRVSFGDAPGSMTGRVFDFRPGAMSADDAVLPRPITRIEDAAGKRRRSRTSK
ncbi:MAG: hypothetical protein AAF762_11130, partial [Pseudomonadota bacterium]